MTTPITTDNAATVAELIRLTDALDRATDDKDWPTARRLFADRVDADFGSLTGVPAARVAADDIVDGWRRNLTPVKTSQHARSNHQVDLHVDRATVRSVAHAWNCMEGGGDPLWEVWGNYEHRFTQVDGGWLIDGMTLVVTHQRGNPWVRDTVPAAEPIQQPITGREPGTDGLTPFGALVEFYRAFNTRDRALMRTNWQASDRIAMDNPVGGIARGWGEIGPLYERLFRSPMNVHVEFFDYTLTETPDIAYAVGRERGSFVADGVAVPVAIRTSRVFERCDGRWRQVHHHGSIEDADLLRRYQQAAAVQRPS